MSTSAANPISIHRVSAITMGMCLGLSVAFHLLAGISATGYMSSSWRSSPTRANALDVISEKTLMPNPPDEIRLGRDEATSASINWLGVLEDPVEGVAPLSEVEQAAFTTEQGNADLTAAPTQAIDPLPVPQEQPSQVDELSQNQETTPTEPDPDPAVQQVLPQEILSESNERQEPDQVNPVQPNADVDDAQQAQQEQALSEQIDLELPESDTSETVLELQRREEENPDLDEFQEQVESQVREETETQGESQVKDDQIEDLVDTNERADSVQDDTIENSESQQQPTESTSSPKAREVPVRSPTLPAQSATKAGSVGIDSDRESTASILKKAINADPKKLNRPIVGQGLELITVEPRFASLVRSTQRPRNPVLLIEFNGKGRVVSVKFLKDQAKTFDTGVIGVDEPLINAVYKWRAKGKEIEALDPNNPSSTLEISMRILFRKEKPAP
jgi:hypothetical protein